MVSRGRPLTLGSQMTELLCELKALTDESIKNELERARITRQFAGLCEMSVRAHSERVS